MRATCAAEALGILKFRPHQRIGHLLGKARIIMYVNAINIRGTRMQTTESLFPERLVPKVDRGLIRALDLAAREQMTTRSELVRRYLRSGVARQLADEARRRGN
jgi:hypothetical protein